METDFLSSKKISKKEWVLEFLPKDLIYLTEVKKIHWNGKNLKTDYLINIIHFMLSKYFFSNKEEICLSSEVLRKWYGTHYNYYLEFLTDHNIIVKTGNYFVGTKCNSFKLNPIYYESGLNNIIRWKNTNPFLLKKWKSKQLEFQIDNITNGKIINPIVKRMIIEDLYHIDIDYKKAVECVENMLKNGILNTDKSYIKNMMSVEAINDGCLFHIEDQYGRLHTNLTVLKKSIRTECIKIDGEDVIELDIANSQPLFLSVLLKEKGFDLTNVHAYEYYKDTVKNGIIYDIIAEEMDISRSECKTKMFCLLFGENKWNSPIDRAFKKHFPEVYNWIVEEKTKANNYKIIAHELQRKESKLIFDTIIYRLKKEIPSIRLFTVHDSIIYPKKWKNKVEEIFYQYVDLLFA